MRPKSGEARCTRLERKTVSIVIAIGVIVGTGSDINVGSNIKPDIGTPTRDASASAIGAADPVKSCRAAARSPAANFLYW